MTTQPRTSTWGVGPLGTLVCLAVIAIGVLLTPVLFFNAVAEQATAGHVPAEIPVYPAADVAPGEPAPAAVAVELHVDQGIKDAYFARSDARDLVLAALAAAWVGHARRAAN